MLPPRGRIVPVGRGGKPFNAVGSRRTCERRFGSEKSEGFFVRRAASATGIALQQRSNAGLTQRFGPTHPVSATCTARSNPAMTDVSDESMVTARASSNNAKVRAFTGGSQSNVGSGRAYPRSAPKTPNSSIWVLWDSVAV